MNQTFTPAQQAASLLGSIRTEKKAAAVRENGKKGGRPKLTTEQKAIRAARLSQARAAYIARGGKVGRPKGSKDKSSSLLIMKSDDYQRILPDGSRIILYSRHTDPQGHKWLYWLCRQIPNPFRAEYPQGPQWTVRDQKYLDKDGVWREPHGRGSVRAFHSTSAAIAFSNALQS